MARFILVAFAIAMAIHGSIAAELSVRAAAKPDQCFIKCGKNGDLPLTRLNGGFYYFHVDKANGKNWHEAFDFCKQHNMELVTIETAAENEAIKQKINSLIPNENDNLSFFWIGLNDLGKEAEYRWASTGQVAHFTDWHNGLPNNHNSENCGEIWKVGGVTKWNDRGCTLYAGRFICEVHE